MSTHQEPSDAGRARIKDYFVAERGYWRPWTETMLQANPAFVQQYARYAGYPARSGPLSARMVELIYVGLDASASHLFESGLRTHVKRALEAGATPADVFDVLHLVAVQGVASACQAAAIVEELSAAAGPPPLDAALQARIGRLGASHALALEPMARMDPGYAGVLLDFLEQGRPGTGLAPTERSLVQLALHACFTAFNPAAVREIVATALAQGLQRAELLQAIQLGAHLAVHGSALGADVFRQVAG
jgi:alkylhydroperoxidase/carboxymuconolactone decarboxylase family protein YurZ